MTTTGEDTVQEEVRLRPPRNTLDGRAVGWWRTRLLITTAVPAVILGVLGALITPARFWLLLPAAIIAAVGLACTAIFPRWWFRVHRWEVTDAAVYVRTGAFWQEWRIAPISRIQTVDIERGPLEQLFGLARITVTTASAAGPLRISGLDNDRAVALADELTRTTQAVRGDAT